MEYQKTINYNSFKMYCKTLELQNNPELIEEYKRVHALGAAWSEVTQGMKEIGILDMEIYILGTCLFMVMDVIPDYNHDLTMEELSKKPRQSEWEAYVSKFQKSESDSTADQKWKVLECIYRLA